MIGEVETIAASIPALSSVAKVFAATRVDITPDAAAEVVARTEGWPVGVYLAAKIASNNDGDVPMITGDDRFVADYLYREAMLPQPDDVQRFLRRTAVLDQMCASLCEAVSGEQASQARLLGLEASSMFVIALDHRRRWYRYHGLFRDFLLAELRRVDWPVGARCSGARGCRYGDQGGRGHECRERDDESGSHVSGQPTGGCQRG